MNTVIKELAVQAGFYFDEYNEPTQRKVELLCELVAQHCARLAMSAHSSTSPDDYDEMDPYDQGCDDTASVISGLIRRVFWEFMNEN